jgi:hypothetical protein
MNAVLQIYTVQVVREASPDPLTGKLYEYAEQTFDVEADRPQGAYKLANRICTLHFCGQLRRTFIDGAEHFDERY